MTDLIINTECLSKRFQTDADCALNSISLKVETGSFVGLLGPNGSGKSTLIAILCGLLKPSKGAAYVCNKSIKFISTIREFIGLVPQKIALYPTLTLIENLRFFSTLYNMSHQQTTEKIDKYLSLLNMQNVAKKRVGSFSGGMLRRANLIAGILHSPKLLFLDEPTANVDAHARSMIISSLQYLHGKGTTIVYTTHYMEEVAALCSNVAILNKGNLVAMDSLSNLKSIHHDNKNFTDIYLSLTGELDN